MPKNYFRQISANYILALFSTTYDGTNYTPSLWCKSQAPPNRTILNEQFLERGWNREQKSEISHLDVTAGGEHVGQVAETGVRQYFGDVRVVYRRGAGHLSVAAAELRVRETGGGGLGRLRLEQQLL